MTHLFHTVNIMAADGLVMQGARASTAMVSSPILLWFEHQEG